MTPQRRNGFLLPELVVALAVALLLVGQIAQATLQQSGQARLLGRLLRERLAGQRALELIRAELQLAHDVHLELPAAGHADCGLANRAVKLHLRTAAGPITYAVESSPDAIWRGKALMRCGPSYGLNGQLNGGSQQSRVVLDALADAGMTVGGDGVGLSLGLIRRFNDPHGGAQVVTSALSSAAPGWRP